MDTCHTNIPDCCTVAGVTELSTAGAGVVVVPLTLLELVLVALPLLCSWVELASIMK